MEENLVETADFQLDKKMMKKAEMVFRAINHKLRQELIYFIHVKGVVAVNEIYRALHIDQSIASQHLGILRKEGIVINNRDGKRVLYSVNYERIKEINIAATDIVKNNF